MMLYFFDTEFIEYSGHLDLISIGVVCEDDRAYYAISKDCDLSKANEWVRAHVLPKLPVDASLWKSREQIKQDLLVFVKGGPEWWACYADYDWVCLCWLFGAMIDLPKGWPMYCRDVKQVADQAQVELPQMHPSVEHSALADAWWTRGAYEYLHGQWSQSVYEHTGCFPYPQRPE